MIKKCWLLVVGLLVCTSLGANAITLQFNGFIADEANLISPQNENDINMMLWDLKKKTGSDIAVVTMNSLNGRDVNSVAIEIGREYKLGDKNKNNGIVFLTAPNERIMSIQLGYGLEKSLGKSTAEQVRDYDVLPYYKQNRYEEGIFRGAYSLAKAVASSENVSVKSYGNVPARISGSCSHRNSDNIPWWAYPFAIIMAIISPRRRGRFSSSGFSGFGGGGGFGGCGCSGRW